MNLVSPYMGKMADVCADDSIVIVVTPPVFLHRLLFPSIPIFSMPSHTCSIVHRFYFCWFPPPTCSSAELYCVDAGVGLPSFDSHLKRPNIVCRCTLPETSQETHKPLQYTKWRREVAFARFDVVIQMDISVENMLFGASKKS
ncbi:hypothetical protein LXL04_010365 [Taraxacum kok-saghyz]